MKMLRFNVYGYGLWWSCKLKQLKYYMDGDTKNILKINCWKYRNHMMTLTDCGIQKGNLFEQEASSYKHNHTHTHTKTDRRDTHSCYGWLNTPPLSSTLFTIRSFSSLKNHFNIQHNLTRQLRLQLNLSLWVPASLITKASTYMMERKMEWRGQMKTKLEERIKRERERTTFSMTFVLRTKNTQKMRK